MVVRSKSFFSEPKFARDDGILLTVVCDVACSKIEKLFLAVAKG